MILFVLMIAGALAVFCHVLISNRLLAAYASAISGTALSGFTLSGVGHGSAFTAENLVVLIALSALATAAVSALFYLLGRKAPNSGDSDEANIVNVRF